MKHNNKKRQNNLVVNKNKLLNLLETYNIHPKSENLWIYNHALTHSSFSHENGLNYNYEKLEFLGDAALQWVITNYIFSNMKNNSEGEMSLLRSGLVCKESLVRASDVLGLSKLALFGKGVNNISNNIKEDLFEAFLGAIAQDVGIKKVSNLINEVIIVPFEKNKFELQRHYKTDVQELFAPRSVKYHIIVNKKNEVEVEILVDGLVYGKGIGRFQKEAEENAAKNAYDKYCKPIK